MRITYDARADAAYIYVNDRSAPGEATNTYLCDPLEVDGMINLDFDSEGRLLGIEVLGASQKLRANVLASADKA